MVCCWGHLHQRRTLSEKVEEALAGDLPADVKDDLQGWYDNRRDPEKSKEYGDRLKEKLRRTRTMRFWRKSWVGRNISPSVRTGSFWETVRRTISGTAVWTT